MARKKRALTENEQELWNKVIKQVETIESMPPLIISPAVKPTKTPKAETPREIKPFKVRHAELCGSPQPNIPQYGSPQFPAPSKRPTRN